MSKVRTIEGQPTVRLRELAAVLLLIVLADLTLYRGHGMAGLAVLFAFTPALLLLGSPRPKFQFAAWLASGMLLALSARLVWLGSVLAAGVGIVLVIMYSVALAGAPPVVSRLSASCASILTGGSRALPAYYHSIARFQPRVGIVVWLSLLLPAVAVALFSTLFVMANPDLVIIARDWIWQLNEKLINLASRLAWWELLFWIATGWIAIGLLRPTAGGLDPFQNSGIFSDATTTAQDSRSYVIVRNTLVSVISLFGLYLIFEFRTLWVRKFPPGFYYAGYAHEGAAWLTVALAAVTLVLSLMFRGCLLRDPRIARVRRLAFAWWLETVLLAIAVYHRMYIYIDFNGLTFKRTIGLFGITTVVIALIFVHWKLRTGRDFWWLVRMQLLTLALAIYLFAIIPVDAIVYRYNVHQISQGTLAPAVQISVHPIDSEGVLQLPPLVHCPDPIIRDGVRALLAERSSQLEETLRQRALLGWTSFQAADQVLFNRLEELKPVWLPYQDLRKQTDAIQRFHSYVYQWY